MRTTSRTGMMSSRLRKGYTTGTCAAAAARAAARMLTGQEIVKTMDVDLPSNKHVTCKIIDQHMSADSCGCGVKKFAGDDPDVTNGIVIYADATWSDDKGITVAAGEGIGMVSKPGLSVAVGEPAINPVPMRMIIDNVKGEIPDNRGIKITIFAPEGKERARKTRNERLGIVGGISILGTSGIVWPMSNESFRKAVLVEIDVALAQGKENIVLVPGKLGENVAKKIGFDEDSIVQMSNFVGDALDYCKSKGVKSILLLGHIGKLVKIAGGCFYTHSDSTENPLEILKPLVRDATKDIAPVVALSKANTADEAANTLVMLGYNSLLDDIAKKVRESASARIGDNVKIGIALTILNGDIIGLEENAKRVIGTVS